MSDLIDRQALLKQIDIDSDGEPGYYGDTWKFIDTIKNMPNVHDLPKDTDTISRQAVEEILDKNQMPYHAYPYVWDAINALPSAQPRMGKWVYHIDDLFPAESTMECNQCHAEQPLTCDDEFCPHCGAKMEVTE